MKFTETEGFARIFSFFWLLVHSLIVCGVVNSLFIRIDYVGTLLGIAIAIFLWWMIWKPRTSDPDSKQQELIEDDLQAIHDEIGDQQNESQDNWLYTKIMTWINSLSKKQK